MNPVRCDSCGARFAVTGLTEDDCRALHDQHYYEGFVEELRMLRRVQEYYCQHPEAEGRIKPHFLRVLESDDPEVKERLCAHVPFDQIELPPEPSPPRSEGTAEEVETIEYLRHHHFALGPRLEFVSQEIARLKGSVGRVPCPRCKVGRLHVRPEDWDQFTAADAITWYWPEWHGIDGDGTLHVKASGWQGGSHWSGEQALAPDHPDYAFWCWLVKQKQLHRLVEEAELPAIRDAWSRRTLRSSG